MKSAVSVRGIRYELFRAGANDIDIYLSGKTSTLATLDLAEGIIANESQTPAGGNFAAQEELIREIAEAAGIKLKPKK